MSTGNECIEVTNQLANQLKGHEDAAELGPLLDTHNEPEPELSQGVEPEQGHAELILVAHMTEHGVAVIIRWFVQKLHVWLRFWVNLRHPAQLKKLLCMT